MKLTHFSFVIALAGFLCCGCQKSETASGTSTNAQSSSGNPVTAPVDYLGAVAKGKKQADKLTDLGIKQAVAQFYAVEGRYPKDLNELVAKKYLSSLPPPPTGMKFQYNPATGEVKTVPQ